MPGERDKHEFGGKPAHRRYGEVADAGDWKLLTKTDATGTGSVPTDENQLVPVDQRLRTMKWVVLFSDPTATATIVYGRWVVVRINKASVTRRWVQDGTKSLTYADCSVDQTIAGDNVFAYLSAASLGTDGTYRIAYKGIG